MERDSIEIFVKVVQLGSFAGAARYLKIPTTTVSYKVAKLEERLGVTLIQRTTRRLNITSSGQLYFNSCLKAISELQNAEAELESSSKIPIGTLRISCAYDVASYLLPPIVEYYSSLYPKVKIELIVTNRHVDLIAEQIDIAIRAGNLANSQLIARKLMGLSSGLWASSKYLKKNGKINSPQDLEKHNFILFSKFQSHSIELFKGEKKFLIPIKGPVESDELESIKMLAESGLGIAKLPNFIGDSAHRAGALVKILPEWNIGDFGKLSLVYPAQQFVTPKLREFIKIALEKTK